MLIPCVLVVKDDSLSKRAVVSLAHHGFDLDVVISEAADLEEFTEDVFQIQPDVVLLGKSMPMAGDEVLSHLLMKHQKLRLIVVSDDSNWMCVFKREDRLLTDLNDLAFAISCA